MAEHTARFDAIGTRWNIQTGDPFTDNEWEGVLEHMQARITEFDTTYSRFRTDSWVTQMSKQAGNYQLPADAYNLLHFYKQLYEVTDGKVTPLIGQTMVEAGYDAAYSFQKGTLQAPPRWEGTLAYDERQLKIKQPVLLDFGAAGKGYLVDVVAALLQGAGCESFVIDAGGDILHHSNTTASIAVGLENPLDTSEAIGIVQLSNKSLCASSGSKRKWQDMHHIIDPVKLRSPADILATWVMADDTMTADGLATALFFTPATELKKRFSFSYAFLTSVGELEYDPDFPVELFKEA